jgi:hypothetical protein
MVDRVSTNVSTLMNPFGPQWSSGAEKAKETKPVGEQVHDALFGKRKPPSLDLDDFPEVKEIMARLDGYRRKFVSMVGDSEDDYRLQLADGTIAMIDAHGTIFLGIRFLLQFRDNLEVVIGALAHEVGHRPQRWGEYKAKQDLSKEDLDSLCRYEETRADLFAGQALAEMGLSPEPMIKFLKDIEEGPHPEYFPASMRADVIREGYHEQKAKASTRKKLWPELERMTSPRLHIGEF